jgi:hypothetical protein
MILPPTSGALATTAAMSSRLYLEHFPAYAPELTPMKEFGL